jgi:hypothetical protein
MSVPGAWPQVPDFFGRPLVLEPSRGQAPGDAGLLPIRQLDRPMGLTQGFTAARSDARDHDSTEQSDQEMVRSGAYSILADCED